MENGNEPIVCEDVVPVVQETDKPLGEGLPVINTPKKKGSNKKILIGAIVVVLLIVLIGRIAKGGSSSDAEKEVKNYLLSMGYQVTNVNTEYKTKYKVKNLDNNKWENAEFTLISATLMSAYSENVQYVLVSCEICENDSFADIDIEYQTDSKGILKNYTRTHIEETKQLIKDLKESGELR